MVVPSFFFFFFSLNLQSVNHNNTTHLNIQAITTVTAEFLPAYTAGFNDVLQVCKDSRISILLWDFCSQWLQVATQFQSLWEKARNQNQSELYPSTTNIFKMLYKTTINLKQTKNKQICHITFISKNYHIHNLYDH